MSRTASSNSIAMRPATFDDLDRIAAVADAQDVEWWGSPDGDVDDVRAELDAVASAHGLEEGSCVACTRDARGERIIGVGLLTGHGQTSLAVDGSSPGAEAARSMLIDWLIGGGATEIEAPIQDQGRLDVLAERGFVRARSSFELERPGAVDDLGPAEWPPGITPAPFRLGVDDEEVHDMIYSVWLDVDGHTYRPIDEWRSRLLHGPWFAPELVVVARRDHGNGPVAGVALGRTYGADAGWISQLAVGRPDRGVGLGRAVLVEAIRRVATRDVPMIGLGVEAENDTALGLYRSVGMHVAREWIHCEPR